MSYHITPQESGIGARRRWATKQSSTRLGDWAASSSSRPLLELEPRLRHVAG